MALLSMLSYIEPELSCFAWNPEIPVVYIDRCLIPLKTFKNSVDLSLDNMKAKMDKLFHGCQWDDILYYINSHTDSNDPDN